MAAADYRLMTEATGQRIAVALENLAGFGAYLTTADVVNNSTSTDPTKVLAAPQGKALYDLIRNLVERQNISVSGFDGTMKETQLTITLKQGFTPYLLQAVSSQFDKNHYIHFANTIDTSTGTFYIEHNLTSTVTTIGVIILWIPNT